MYRQTKRVAELMGERTLGVELELEFELIQTRMAQKPLLRVEVGKSACVLVISLRDVDCASLLLLDMTRINPTYGLSLSLVSCAGL